MAIPGSSWQSGQIANDVPMPNLIPEFGHASGQPIMPGMPSLGGGGGSPIMPGMPDNLSKVPWFSMPQGGGTPAVPQNPTGGNDIFARLLPQVTAIKGAGDLARVDPRTWFPGVMTLFHKTRKPGAAEAGTTRQLGASQ